MASSDISLTSGMRGSLLSLQGNSRSIDRTQERLSTGRKVNSALDNPTNFFASQAHLNRAGDLNGRKDSVKEAIQNIHAANNGITAISSLLSAANGLANAALGTNVQVDRTSFSTQFDTVLNQIDTLANDSGYRGTNLLKSDSLTVNFSESAGQSTLSIAGVDATSSGLAVSKTSSGGGTSTSTQTAVNMGTGKNVTINFNITNSVAYSGPPVPQGGSTTVTIDISATPDMTPTVAVDTAATIGLYNTTHVPNFGDDVSGTLTGDSKSLTVTTNSAFYNYTPGDSIHIGFIKANTTVAQRTFGTNNTAAELSNIKVGGVLKTAGTDYNLVTRSGDGKADIVFTTGNGPASGAAITADVTATTTAGANPWTSTANIQTSQNQVNAAITTMRSNAKSLASNSTILTTRLDYISGMVNILQTGADNLTLADMNEEGASMLMLQTRQSLGTTSLSMGAQAAQSVMRLF